MQLEILGSRGNIPVSARGHVRHSGVLIGDHILLDLGEVTYLRYRPSYIFITHLHPDHAAFMGGDIITDAQFYLPERTRRLPAATVLSRPVRIGSYRVVPVPTVHSVKVQSVGYVVEKGNRRVFFSSDMVSIDSRYHGRLRRLDLVITDGSFMRRGGLVRIDPASGARFGHAGIPDLVEFFSAFTRRIILTHFGSWFYKDVAAAKRQIAALGNAVQVSAARDGLVIDL